MNDIVNAVKNHADGSASIRLPTAYYWLLILSALPLLTALLSFRPDGEFTDWQRLIRQFWLPAQIFEIATVILALSLGCSLKREWASSGRSARWLVPLWMVLAISAALMADMRDTALLSLFSWVIHLLFVVSAIFLFRQWSADEPDKLWQRVSDFVPLGSAAFVIIMAVFFWVVGIDTDYDWAYSLPGFTHMRHSGYFLLPAMAISTAVIVGSDRTRQYSHIALLAINSGYAIWIGSRGPLMAYVAVLAGGILLFAALRRPRALAALAITLGFGALLSQAAPTPDHPSFNVFSRMESSQSQSADEISSGRTEIWRDTIEGIMQQPVIGHGGNQFRFQVPAAKLTYNHPHNSILQFAYEWGVIGAAAVLAMLALLGIRLFRATLNRPEACLPFFLAWMSMAAFSLIDGVFYYNLPIMLFTLCAVGVLAQAKASPQ